MRSTGSRPRGWVRAITPAGLIIAVFLSLSASTAFAGRLDKFAAEFGKHKSVILSLSDRASELSKNGGFSSETNDILTSGVVNVANLYCMYLSDLLIIMDQLTQSCLGESSTPTGDCRSAYNRYLVFLRDNRLPFISELMLQYDDYLSVTTRRFPQDSEELLLLNDVRAAVRDIERSVVDLRTYLIKVPTPKE